MNDSFSEFLTLFSDFSDAGSSESLNLWVWVLQFVENFWENFSLTDNLSKINSMSGNIRQTVANVLFQLSIMMLDESGKEWDCTSINNVLSKFTGMLADFSQSLSRDSLQGSFWFLDTQDK